MQCDVPWPAEFFTSSASSNDLWATFSSLDAERPQSHDVKFRVSDIPTQLWRTGDWCFIANEPNPLGDEPSGCDRPRLAI